MRDIINLVGNKYGRLTVISFAGIKHKQAAWNCLCECGRVTVVCSQSLKRGGTRSCGCLRDELTRGRNSNENTGFVGTRLYVIWQGMLQRCENPNNPGYKRYGGRGITVCTEWHDFQIFRAWALTHGYKDVLTIERIDVNSGYNPFNCIWIPWKIQPRNQERNKKITINGETHILSDWLSMFHIKKSTYRRRKELGWSTERALLTPVRKWGRHP